MTKEKRKKAKDIFSHYGQEFVSKLILNDENFFIMDWKDKNGSGNLATRYIVDKSKGDIIIKGDAGFAIASWYNKLKVKDLASFMNDVGYFVGKIQCTTDKYSYKPEDVKLDLLEIKEEYLKLARNDDLEMDEEEVEEDFSELLDLYYEYGIKENSTIPSDMTDIMEKYDSCWWETFSDVGKRISTRIYLWIYGFQKGIEMLEELGIEIE